MNIIHWIQAAVFACAIAALIVSFYKMAEVPPSGHVSPESFFNPGFLTFICSVVVILVDVVLWAAIEVWNVEVGLGAILFMSICAAVLLIASHARAGLLSVWSKFKGPPSTAPAKRPWLSKTIIFNTVVAAMILAERNIASLQGFLPPGGYQALSFVVPIVNMMLRAYTTQGISFTPQIPQEEAGQ